MTGILEEPSQTLQNILRCVSGPCLGAAGVSTHYSECSVSRAGVWTEKGWERGTVYLLGTVSWWISVVYYHPNTHTHTCGILWTVGVRFVAVLLTQRFSYYRLKREASSRCRFRIKESTGSYACHGIIAVCDVESYSWRSWIIGLIFLNSHECRTQNPDLMLPTTISSQNEY